MQADFKMLQWQVEWPLLQLVTELRQLQLAPPTNACWPAMTTDLQACAWPAHAPSDICKDQEIMCVAATPTAEVSLVG